MEYHEKRMDNFDLITINEDGKTYVTLLFEGYHCEEFEAAVTGQSFKHGLLIKPIKGKENCENRTYYFFNNNGDEVFRTKRRMNSDKTEFVEDIKFFEDLENVGYKKISADGDVVAKTYNIATNAEVVEGQISFF